MEKKNKTFIYRMRDKWKKKRIRRRKRQKRRQKK